MLGKGVKIWPCRKPHRVSKEVLLEPLVGPRIVLKIKNTEGGICAPEAKHGIAPNF